MKYLKYIWHLSIICLTMHPKQKNLHLKMVTIAPVTNLRGVPQDISADFKLPASSKTNQFQISQLLYNEYVITKQKFIDKQNKTWYLVDALQQPTKNKNGSWGYLSGWVQAQDLQLVDQYEERNLVVKSLFADIYNDKHTKINTLFIGTGLTGSFHTEKNMFRIQMPDSCCGWIAASDVINLSKDTDFLESKLRASIINTAQKFLGNLYSWGGRTPQTNLLPVSSVDCSGLINLVFAAHGLLIPRNSVSQYQKATHIKQGKNLQAGDLIFFANDQHRINHVILYAGNGMVIEASLTAGKVSTSSFKKRIGIDHTKMKSGDLSGPIMTIESETPTYFRVYFASFLSDKQLIHKLWRDFLYHK